jgi:N6-adenosine-specific RNA methylase IME4
VVSDCPWSYRNVNTGGSMKSGSAQKYSTMSLEEICAMKVPEIMDPRGSVLFLWATTPLLPEAFRVMNSWKYKYKTAIYWRKIMSLGMGYWFRGQVELCLVGIRGKVPAFQHQKPNFIQSKVRAHSQKPEEFWELINPALDAHDLSPRIELFCRGESRPGWDGWGSECAKSQNLSL